MNKIVLFAIATALTTQATAQIAGRKTSEGITVQDNVQVNPGDTLYFGAGSDQRGDFVYIYQPPNAILNIHGGTLSKNYARKYAVVKHFKKQKDRRTGEKTVAVINVAGGLNQVADVEQAIDAKEIVAINRHSFARNNSSTVVVQASQLSTADEIKKLKGLYDDGILTKEEYEAQKKKLLEKN